MTGSVNIKHLNQN